MSEIDKNLYADAAEISLAIGKKVRSTFETAQKDKWQYVEVDSRGRNKKKWFLLAKLPKPIRNQVKQARLQALLLEKPEPAPVPEGETITQDPRACTSRQRAAHDARCLVVAEAKKLMQQAHCSMNSALITLLTQAKLGQVSAELLNALRLAKFKREGLPSVRTLERWLETCDQQLLPKVKQPEPIPEWMPVFLAVYRRPQKPSVVEAHRDFEQILVANGYPEAPSYWAVSRALKKVPNNILVAGRHTGSELKAQLPFVRRDWSGASNQYWVGDGHTFKAKVRHPEHGQPFAPEVTVIIDANSRKIVGYAFSLSENQLAVGEALGNGMKKYGKPMLYYSDNGSGQTAKTIDCPVGGMMARFGIDHQTGIPGNPQARGIIEGLWDITCIAVAKTYPTFQGTGMDDGTLRKVTGEINKAKRKGEAPAFVPPWSQFMADCIARFDWYNAQHAHRALNGKTPDQVYAESIDPLLHLPLSDEELKTLYRPFVERIPARGEIQLFKNRYFLKKLEELAPGTKVRVAYDLFNADVVWVSDLAGRLIGEALWDGNKTKAFPESYEQQLKDKRINAVKQRAQDKVDLINQEQSVLEGEVLERVELPALPIPEPLKIVPVDFVKQEAEEQRMSYLETLRFINGDENPEAETG